MLLLRVAAILSLAFGVIGIAACAAGAYGIWLVESRLDRANDKVFDAVDRGLAVVQDRVPAVQQRVRDSKVTTATITESAREWAAKKAQERIVSQLEIENRAEKLLGLLHAANLRLEASTEVVRDVRQMLELGQSLGAQVDPASTDVVLDALTSLRGAVEEAERTIDRVRGFATPGGGESVAEHLARVAKLLARIQLTLSDVDSRLDELAIRLSEVRADARQLKARTSRSIMLGSVVGYGLLAWVAAGQTALCWWGWNRCRRGLSPACRTGG